MKTAILLLCAPLIGCLVPTKEEVCDPPPACPACAACPTPASPPPSVERVESFTGVIQPALDCPYAPCPGAIQVTLRFRDGVAVGWVEEPTASCLTGTSYADMQPVHHCAAWRDGSQASVDVHGNEIFYVGIVEPDRSCLARYRR